MLRVDSKEDTIMTTRSAKPLLALPVLLFMVISGCATYRQAKEIDAEIKKIDEKMDTVKEIDTEVKKIEGKLDTMLEQPAPVTKETAAAIAIRFAGLKTVTAIKQPQVNYSHTQTFNVIGNDGKGDILIGLDPEESPRLDLDDPTTVEPGMALAVRTSVAKPDVGGAFFADTILVGEDKAATLSKLP